MGFEVSTTGSVLEFPDDSKYPGLEVRLDEASIGAFTEILEDYSRISGGKAGAAEAAKALRNLTGNFARALESWNVTRKGEPVPATAEGLRSLGRTFVMDVIRAWLTGTVQPGDDLGKGSPSGGSSGPGPLEAAASLSSSLPSSSPQRL